MTTLLQRDTAGLHVQIDWLPTLDEVALNVRRGDECAATLVPRDRVLDAFDHPTVYLNDAQVDLLFPRPQ